MPRLLLINIDTLLPSCQAYSGHLQIIPADELRELTDHGIKIIVYGNETEIIKTRLQAFWENNATYSRHLDWGGLLWGFLLSMLSWEKSRKF